MTSRILSRDEWPTKLAGTDLESVLAMLPTETRVIVVEDADGKVIGHWALIRYLHAEAVWVDPEHRKKGGVIRHLLTQMRRAASGEASVWTASMSPEVDRLLTTLHATKLPGDHYVIPVGE